MARCVVLMYHVVDLPRSASEARFCCRPAMFAAQMRHLADDGWRVIALSELVAALRVGREPLLPASPARTGVAVAAVNTYTCVCAFQ